MEEYIIICVPGDIYWNNSALKTAKLYTPQAIDEYDKLITFDPEYAEKKVNFEGKVMNQAEVPDYVQKIGEKRNLELWLSLFAKQPMIKVGDIGGEFTSTSYLIGPQIDLGEGLYVPDIDVVQIEGDGRIKDAAETIANFYDKTMGWKVHMLEGTLEQRQTVTLTSPRLLGSSFEIVDSKILRQIAKTQLFYDMNDLCFKAPK